MGSACEKLLFSSYAQFSSAAVRHICDKLIGVWPTRSRAVTASAISPKLAALVTSSLAVKLSQHKALSQR